MFKLHYIILLLSLLIYGCKPKQLDKDSLHKYIRDDANGLISKKQVGDVNVEVYFKPSDLVAVQEVEGNSALDNKQIKAVQSRYNGCMYFVVSMCKEGKEVLNSSKSKQEYNQLLNELLFKMGEHVVLLGDDKDTIEMIDYVYPRLYAAKTTDMLFAFQKKDIEKYNGLEMVIGDIGLRIGTNKFYFQTADLLNAPRLEYKQKK